MQYAMSRLGYGATPHLLQLSPWRVFGVHPGQARRTFLWPSRSGTEWIMHAKSGYTAYRVPVREAEDYFHVQHQASLTQVAERCG